MNCLPHQEAKKPEPVSDVAWVPAWGKHQDAGIKVKDPVLVVARGLDLKVGKNRYT
jgi:hypothetical protein